MVQKNSRDHEDHTNMCDLAALRTRRADPEESGDGRTRKDLDRARLKSASPSRVRKTLGCATAADIERAGRPESLEACGGRSIGRGGGGHKPRPDRSRPSCRRRRVCAIAFAGKESTRPATTPTDHSVAEAFVGETANAGEGNRVRAPNGRQGFPTEVSRCSVAAGNRAKPRWSRPGLATTSRHLPTWER